jgi:transcriptional regulator with XRE-family HTH domain
VDRDNLPNRLRELREAAGLSIGELAARLGVTNQEIGHLELGKRRLTTDWLMRLAKALGRHPWEIMSHAIVAELTEAETRLLIAFRALPKRSQQALLLEVARRASADSKDNKRSK